MFRVTADIKYIDGSLAGLVIPAGFSTTVTTRARAASIAGWLAQTRKDLDFVRAVGTGNKYHVVSAATVDELAQGDATRRIGDGVVVRGVACTITKLLPLGTVEVASLDGAHAWRVSGLGL